MSGIFLKYFDSVYSLNSFLYEVNCNMKNKNDDLRLRKLLLCLSKVTIAFDFKLDGPFKSMIDTRYTYEQTLYLCYHKVNESKFQTHIDHMFRSNPNPKYFGDSELSNLYLPQEQLEKKLLAYDNLSLCYFLSKAPHDGVYWRELFSLIGASIFKYILLYSYVFRQLSKDECVYVQVCGRKMNTVYKSLMNRYLTDEDKNFWCNNATHKAKINDHQAVFEWCNGREKREFKIIAKAQT
jgi:hypothetical protein